MRKIVAILLSLVMLASSAACSRDADSIHGDESASKNAQVSEKIQLTNKGSFANVGVVKSICKQVQTAAYQGSNHGISATGGFTSHGYSCRNRVSFVN